MGPADLLRIHYVMAGAEKGAPQIAVCFKEEIHRITVWKGMPVSMFLLIVKALGEDNGEDQVRLLVRSPTGGDEDVLFFEGSTTADSQRCS